MTKPIPDIAQMLEVALNCGLNTLEEAYQNYLNHHDCFFYLPELSEQMNLFVCRLKEAGLCLVYGSSYIHYKHGIYIHHTRASMKRLEGLPDQTIIIDDSISRHLMLSIEASPNRILKFESEE